MLSPRYDLYSDTKTRPTLQMRKAMCDAEVGDEQNGEDPTTNKLQDMVAEKLNKEAALYLPSGTMCNEISYLVNCSPGDEIIMDITAHPYNAEAGGPAALGGITTRPLWGTRGIFTGAQVEEVIRPIHRLWTRSRLVSVEQTTNLAGGFVWPMEAIDKVASVARQHNLYMHMDGARLFNAAVASGIPASEYTKHFDSVWIDFSKGLAAPVGAVMAGSREFIDEAWRWKQRLGGAMRQSGIIAAACIYALENNIDRLAEDHENAQYIAELLGNIPGITINPDGVETNIVIFDIAGTGKSSAQMADDLLKSGVRFSIIGKTRMRAVTYLSVTRNFIDEAIEIVRNYLR